MTIFKLTVSNSIAEHDEEFYFKKGITPIQAYKFLSTRLNNFYEDQRLDCLITSEEFIKAQQEWEEQDGYDFEVEMYNGDVNIMFFKSDDIDTLDDELEEIVRCWKDYCNEDEEHL